jgi:hypothetical protein
MLEKDIALPDRKYKAGFFNDFCCQQDIISIK